MDRFDEMNPRQRLVHHIAELERVELLKQRAADCLKESFEAARRDGFDTATLKVVLRLRKMTPAQRRERRALEAIYLAALGMLEGDPLPDEARRRLDREAHREPEATKRDHEPDATTTTREPDDSTSGRPDDDSSSPSLPPAQQPLTLKLTLKDPDEARQEGAAAAAAGKRIYDNPYPAGDPCRAAWDEGWCAQSKSHGMETPEAYRRRKDSKEDKDDQKPGESSDLDKKGAA